MRFEAGPSLAAIFDAPAELLCVASACLESSPSPSMMGMPCPVPAPAPLATLLANAHQLLTLLGGQDLTQGQDRAEPVLMDLHLDATDLVGALHYGLLIGLMRGLHEIP